ncbi:WXG100 family type VII secretion target [Streptomyces sp. NPDC056632]|uniref:WXG100 family type VII secretion target n=1 Tax=Streptomyces sp. NPDC056632 TaxID=3345884 RepID=UPI00367F749A
MAYSYDLEDLRDACAILRQYSAQFQENLDNLNQSVNLTANWEGLSGDSFRNTVGIIKGNVENVQQWIDGVVPYMEDMADGIKDEDHRYAYDLSEAG